MDSTRAHDVVHKAKVGDFFQHAVVTSNLARRGIDKATGLVCTGTSHSDVWRKSTGMKMPEMCPLCGVGRASVAAHGYFISNQDRVSDLAPSALGLIPSCASCNTNTEKLGYLSHFLVEETLFVTLPRSVASEHMRLMVDLTTATRSDRMSRARASWRKKKPASAPDHKRQASNKKNPPIKLTLDTEMPMRYWDSVPRSPSGRALYPVGMIIPVPHAK